MKTIDFSLDAAKNGGKITDFHYSHSLNELVGSWSASVAGGTFKAGNSISFNGVMENGIITSAYKDSGGLWHIEGKDAGVRLMKSTPDVSELPEGNAKAVLQTLANFCGITLRMQVNGLTGFSVRSVISGSTCAEAILELAMFSGLIAYIDNSGKLVVDVPSNSIPTFEDVIDDSGSDIDLDGYATQVLVTLNRRKKQKPSDETEEQEDKIVTLGETPSRQPEKKRLSGTVDKAEYSITMLEPFGVIEKSTTEFKDNDIIIKTEEEHIYDYKSKVIWRDNQEYVLFAFIETGYTLERTAKGKYHGTIQYSSGDGSYTTATDPNFEEVTTETFSRELLGADAEIGIPDEWNGQIKMVSKETITRSTQRTSDVTPDDDMPDYAPPFDSKITRIYSSKKRGKGILCDETEETYEARQVGTIAPVKIDGENVPHFLQGSSLAIQSHSTPEWVLIKKKRSCYDLYDDDGDCIISTRSEYSDDGAEWMLQHSLHDTGDNELNKYMTAYAAFSQNAHGMNVSIGSAGISSAWQFLELRGRIKVQKSSDEDIDYNDKEQAVLSALQEWYANGEYIRAPRCPHYNIMNKACNVYILDDSDKDDDSPEAPTITDNENNLDYGDKTNCFRMQGTFHWLACPRAIEALRIARDIEIADLEQVIIGTASREPSLQNINESNSKNPAIGYQRDIYVDDTLTNEKAQEIADTIAENILTVKGIKGFRKTVTVPYNTDFQPNGVILEVSHDWENLTTSITYKDEGEIPECLISQSVASIAAFVLARENSKTNITKYGTVVSISDDIVSVKVGISEISCSTKLKNLGENDIVLVSFPAGNKFKGQVVARL